MHLEFKFDTTAIQNQFKRLQDVGKSDGLTRKIANVLWSEAEQALIMSNPPRAKNGKP